MIACVDCRADVTHRKVCPQCGSPVVFRPKVKEKRELELPIKKRIREALASAGCMAMIHNVDNRQLATGLGDGVSDIICIVPPLGRFLGVEVKRPKYSPSDVSDAQRAWLAAVRLFGGVSGIATCVEEAIALVAEARQPRQSDAFPPQP